LKFILEDLVTGFLNCGYIGLMILDYKYLHLIDEDQIHAHKTGQPNARAFLLMPASP
jgi:hypothetical protein